MKNLIHSLATVCLLLLGLQAWGQGGTVTGRVLDSEGEPVMGAAVLIQGTSNGVITDLDGNFTLAGIPAGGANLTASSLGYKSQDIAVKPGQTGVVITLEGDSMLLEETVVVGYGTQKKVNLTGAITAVEAKELENRTSHNVGAMLQGAVPGLNIVASAGTPSSTPSINIRGVTSINGASPLILIDGAEGDLNHVASEDIASISVIKDAAAAAIYGARAAYGVILVTTRSGESKDGKGAQVHYSARFGWEQPTTKTDYETRGYWSVYAANLFWASDSGGQYVRYDDNDMNELLARINDKTEDPSRPWVIVTTNKSGQPSYKYYGNTDFYHVLVNDRHPVQQHTLSLSGGNKKVRYYVSGSFDDETGVYAQIPDEFKKYNLRSKIDFQVNKWIRFSNNTSFYSGTYSYNGINDTEYLLSLGASHGLACFVPKNPDGTWVYKTDWTDYAVNNGSQIASGNGYNVSLQRRTDVSNTSELKLTPVKGLQIVANYTYRWRYKHNTKRKTNFVYSPGPGREGVYDTGGAANYLNENILNYWYSAANIYASYENTWNGAHHFTATAGANYETEYNKTVHVGGYYLISNNLSDLDLVGLNPDGVVQLSASGGQSEYAIMGYFGRVNYDYKGRYLIEFSGRYDGTSRFAPGHRWGFFPSVSAGWRISEEPFFAPAKNVVNNLKVRASFGSLGNQNVANYAYLRTISLEALDYSFNEGSGKSRYSTVSAPNSSSLTWETSEQYNIGLDAAFLGNRLEFAGEAYIRDTKNMLTSGDDLPSVYGASAPKENNADLRTKGYELSLSWRDSFKLLGKPFNYNVRVNMSDYASYITKFNNPTKSFAKSYYEGMRLGDVWGYCTDGLFATDDEARQYVSEVDLGMFNKRLTGGWLAGDVKFLDINGDGKLSAGQNTADDPGDRKILGNSLPSLHYGIQFGFDWAGLDVSVFLQGVGEHYEYPHKEMMQFWGGFSRPYVSYLPTDFLGKLWSEQNPDSYFPRPRAYLANTSGSYLTVINDRYLQNMAYLRLKNLTVGYTLPSKITKAVKLDKVRVYFAGENIAYWSPFKKNCAYIDPEAVQDLGYVSQPRYYNCIYPWQASYMFGIDITF